VDIRVEGKMQTAAIHTFMSVAMLCMILHAQPLVAQNSIPQARLLQDLTKAPTRGDTAVALDQPVLQNAWGLDILFSNGGFGLGAFYGREFNNDLFGFTNISISESKDDREVERFDPYTQISFVPGKLNRFLVIPLIFGLQHRLFRDEILDTFRPYVNIGAGPTMIYATPFTEIVRSNDGSLQQLRQVEFFESLGKGHPHYTLGGFIGLGANIGSDRSNILGVNLRYYFTYLFSGGIPSLYDTRTGNVSSNKTEFGGFFITLNVGMAY
jgi:hypothetical protein